MDTTHDRTTEQLFCQVLLVYTTIKHGTFIHTVFKIKPFVIFHFLITVFCYVYYNMSIKLVSLEI